MEAFVDCTPQDWEDVVDPAGEGVAGVVECVAAGEGKMELVTEDGGTDDVDAIEVG